MALRTGHGNGAGVPRDVLPADELPAGVPGPRRRAVGAERRADGRLIAGEGTGTDVGDDHTAWCS